MTSADLTAALALAAASHDTVTTAQLRNAGIDPRVAQRQLRAGHWQRPARGVYVPHRRTLSGTELGHAAAALAGGRVVVTGLVAARLLGLRWVPPTQGVLALVDDTIRTPSSGQVTLRRTHDIATLETWTRSGVELALPARAVVDAARELTSLRDVRGIVLGAVADGWCDVTTLTDVLATTQRNGSGTARRAVRDAARGAASPPEAELVDALIGCGRPFSVNPTLLLKGSPLGSPDVWLAGLGLGAEVESQERHGTDEQVESTYDRHERMAAAGIELVHLSVRRIRRDVRAAADHLLSRAGDRARRGLGDPPGLMVVPRGPLLS